MPNTNNKREIEALGYRWTLSENDVDSDMERGELDKRARSFIFNQGRKPAAVSAIYNLLLPNYPDILSATEVVTPLAEKEGHDSFLFLTDLLYTPANWLALIRPLWEPSREEELKQLRALWDAAKELNPHWYPPNPMEDAPAEALAVIAGVDAQLDPANTTDFEPPEPEEVVAAANEIAASAEEKAKEAGLVGPSSFSSKSKGSGKQRVAI